MKQMYTSAFLYEGGGGLAYAFFIPFSEFKTTPIQVQVPFRRKVVGGGG